MAEAMARPVVDEGLAGPRGVGRDGLPDLKEERRFWAEDLRLMAAGRACSVFWDIRVWASQGPGARPNNAVHVIDADYQCHQSPLLVLPPPWQTSMQLLPNSPTFITKLLIQIVPISLLYTPVITV